MDNLQWRFRARVVACINMVLSIVSVLFAIVLTIGAFVTIQSAPNESATWGLPLMLTLIVNIIVGVHLWTALKLLSATEKGKPADEALQKSRIWLKVNIILLVIFGVLDIWSWNSLNSRIASNEADGETSYSILSSIIGYAICSIMLFIVCKFIQELKIIVSSSGCASAPVANNLDCVYVKK